MADYVSVIWMVECPLRARKCRGVEAPVRFAFGASAPLLLCGILLTGCPPPPSPRVEPTPPVAELRRDPIDLLTGEHLDAAGRIPVRAEHLTTPSYAQLPIDVLWREIAKSSKLAFVALKPASENRGFFKGRSLLKGEDVARTRSDLLASVPGLHEVAGKKRALHLPQTASGMVFPGFFATIPTRETLVRLRARKDVDYIEPMFPTLVPADSISCGYDPYAPAIEPALADEQVLVGGSPDIVPYTFRHLGITEAWKRFRFPGQGVHLALLDTGVSTEQDQLQAGFAQGVAPRPAPVHLDMTGTGLNDDCGHGTKVAGIAVAPKDGRSIVGALWGATLTTVKVGGSPQHLVFPRDTIPDDADVSRICGGIALAAAAHAQIVMMAFGYSFYSPTIAQCITDAFDTTSMIFIAAAGTTVSWVTFPANMNREVIAASAVYVTGPHSYRMFGKPGSVAYGPDVDFVSVMGDSKVPTTGRVGRGTTQEIAAGGGSSSAVPHIAAIFGLAIQATAGTTPPLTRAQLISRVRAASSISNVRDENDGVLQAGNIGAGIPDAYAVAGGTTRVEIAGPATVQVNRPFVVAALSNGESPLDFSWRYSTDGGRTFLTARTRTVTAAASSVGSVVFDLTAVDPLDKKTFQVRKSIGVTAGPVPPPTVRHLASVDYVSHGPTALTGGRNDFVVNAGISMPSGCIVQARLGHTQCTDGGLVHDCAQTSTQPSANYSTYGFTVSSPPGSAPNSLETDVHLWHDGVHDVAVRVHYTVLQPAGTSCDVRDHTQDADRQACFDDNQCASQLCNGLGQGGSGTPGLCADRKALGQPCKAHPECLSGRCDAGDGSSRTNLCVPNGDGQGGNLCSNDDQCVSRVCSGLSQSPGGGWKPGACAAVEPAGSACSSNSQCSSGYCEPHPSGATCSEQKPLGAICAAHVQCGSGYCDAGSGTSNTGRCMPDGSGQSGEPCSNDNQCATSNCQDLTRDAAGAWTPGTCEAKRALGAGCSAHPECESGYCDAGDGTSRTNRCMPNKVGRPGEICSNDNQCASTICRGLGRDPSGAWIPGACDARRALGENCRANVQCASGYCDAGDGTSRTDRCMPNKLGQDGDICSNDNQCVFLNCSGLRQDAAGAWIPGVCADKKPLRETCTAHAQCSSGYCDSGTGTSRTGLCLPNKNGQGGDPCSHPNQCVSLDCRGLRQDASGAWLLGACASGKPQGAACSSHAECDSGYCDSSAGGVCTNRSPLGAACAGNAQCLSGVCDTGIGSSKTGLCVPDGYGQAGDLCTNDNQCGSRNCSGLRQDASGAWIPGVCASKGALGAGCSANAECGSGYCDAGNGTSKTNRCMPNRDGQSGDICSNDGQCASLYCQGLSQDSSGAWSPGACANKAGLGQHCSRNYQCGSGYCDTGNNTSHTELCMPNGDGRAQDPCSHPNQCASRVCVNLQAVGGQWVPGTCQ